MGPSAVGPEIDVEFITRSIARAERALDEARRITRLPFGPETSVRMSVLTSSHFDLSHELEWTLGILRRLLQTPSETGET